jgi:cytochrome c-type biogenesis protein CcmH
LFKDQVAELEADLKAGNITQEQFDQSHADLERNLLQDVSEEDGDKKATRAFSGNITAIVVGIAVPLVAIGLYAYLGEGAVGFEPENASAASMTTEGHQGTIEQQVRKLQDHLQENPDDLEGWVMLARSYYFLKQYQAASDAFARAVAMTGEDNPNILADYADALAMASGGMLSGKPHDLIQKALSLDPNHQKALWLAGTETYNNKDYEATLDYWLKLRKQFPEGSDSYLQMTRNIAEVKQLLGMDVNEEAAIIQQAQAGQAGSGSPAAGGSGAPPKVSGVVSLDPSLQDKVSPNDTLFVFARAASGPRMPLAIIRTSVSDLPLEFTLDDSQSMNPQMKISRFDKVVVGARISKSGQAMPQSGDLSGQTGVVSLGSEDLKITIDGVVP